MKTLKLLSLIALLFIISNSYSQTCSSRIIKYTGPTSREELKQLLNTSTDPAITSLSESTKQSLVNLMVFENGRFIGMDDIDANIQTLENSNSTAVAVFSAILKMSVIVSTSDTRPVVVDISVQQFNTTYGGNPVSLRITGSLCTACRRLGNDKCCTVSRGNCIDYLISIGGTLYRII